jgi:hypothetical protein
MLIFFGKSRERQNIPPESPVDETVENALNIFRGLEPEGGFIGIILDGPFVLHLSARRKGIEIELLDSSALVAEYCEGADNSLAEDLIKAAGNGDNIFQIARQRMSGWKQLKMQ